MVDRLIGGISGGLLWIVAWGASTCIAGGQEAPVAAIAPAHRSGPDLQLQHELPTDLLAPPYGGPATYEETARLEKALTTAPDDFAAHIRLLVYYSGEGSRFERARAARLEHILWIVRNKPESSIAGDAICSPDPLDSDAMDLVKAAWDEQVKKLPNSLSVSKNAAEFMGAYSPLSGIVAWKRVVRLAPDDSSAIFSVAQCYERQLMSSPSDWRVDVAHGALTAYLEGVHRPMEVSRRGLVYWRIIMMAMDTRSFDIARQYAELSLKLTIKDVPRPIYDYLKFAANTALGRLAFRDGDIAVAKDYLKACAATVPPFCEDRGLLSDLLRAGATEDVIQFLDQAITRTPGGSSEFRLWKSQISGGAFPPGLLRFHEPI